MLHWNFFNYVFIIVIFSLIHLSLSNVMNSFTFCLNDNLSLIWYFNLKKCESALSRFYRRFCSHRYFKVLRLFKYYRNNVSSLVSQTFVHINILLFLFPQLYTLDYTRSSLTQCIMLSNFRPKEGQLTHSVGWQLSGVTLQSLRLLSPHLSPLHPHPLLHRTKIVLRLYRRNALRRSAGIGLLLVCNLCNQRWLKNK